MGYVEVLFEFSDQSTKHKISTELTDFSEPLVIPGIFSLSLEKDFSRLRFGSRYSFEVTAFDDCRQICLSSVIHEPDTSVQYLLSRGVELFCDITPVDDQDKLVGQLRIR